MPVEPHPWNAGIGISVKRPAVTAPGFEPRRAAYDVLEQVRAGLPFEVALDRAVKRLTEPDRRLAHELAAGVLRSQTALDDSLAPLVPGGWASVAPELKHVLRLGAFQLTALDRVPPHAAVDTSVALAKAAVGARAGGFVNAVLRRLGRSEPAETRRGVLGRRAGARRLAPALARRAMARALRSRGDGRAAPVEQHASTTGAAARARAPGGAGGPVARSRDRCDRGAVRCRTRHRPQPASGPAGLRGGRVHRSGSGPRCWSCATPICRPARPCTMPAPRPVERRSRLAAAWAG